MIKKFKHHVPNVAADAFVHEAAVVIGEVTLKSSASVWPCAVVRGDMAEIIVGERTSVQDGCLLHTAVNAPLKIGNAVTIGHGAVLHSCTVGDECLIGMGAIVLDGAIIEAGAIVGAGAVVPPGMRVPSGKVVMGTPAKVVRDVRAEDISHMRLGVQEYMALILEYKNTK